MGANLRLFIACELPDATRRGLAAVQDGLREEGLASALRFVQPAGIHLTLKFLGAVPEERVGPIREALAGAIKPFSLTVRPEHLGGFGGARLRVVWVGLEGDTAGLSALAARIEAAVEPLGFEREHRPFAAHLTLARVRDGASPEERRGLAELARGYSLPAQPSITLTEVSLIQSILGRGGSVYRPLAAFPDAPRAASP